VIQKYQTKQCLPKTGHVWCLKWYNAWTGMTLGLVQLLHCSNSWNL